MCKKYLAAFLGCLLALSAFVPLPAGADTQEVGDEVLLNGDFDDPSVTEPKRWGFSRKTPNDVVVVTEASGNRYISLKRITDNAEHLSIIQTARPIDPGASYVFRMDYKTDGEPTPLVSIRYRDANVKHIDQITKYPAKSTNGEWVTVEIPFTTPYKEGETTKYLNVEIEDSGAKSGTLSLDNISCTKTNEAPAVALETDEKFYYTGTETGMATLEQTGLKPLPSDTVVDFSLVCANGEMVKSAENVAFTEGKASFSLPVKDFTEKETYTVTYVLRSGTDVLETGAETVYRYKRPSMITSEGKITWKNSPFLPVMGYHVQTNNTGDYEYCRKVGINVIQFFPWTTNADAIKTRLDLLAKNELLAFIALYSGTEDDAIKIVDASKGHEAVFGYMLMDEPLHNGVTEERLENLYKIVRDRDDVHPTYIVESMAKKDKYAISARYCDIFATDPYPANVEITGTYSTYGVELAKAAVNEKKPIMCINQCYLLQGYQPDGEAVRNMTYQALLAGADGIGYYDLRDSTGKSHVWQRGCWDDMVSFAENELDFAFKSFITGEYQTLSESRSDTIWYRTFRVGDTLRAIILNRTNALQSAAIPFEGPYSSVVTLAGNAETAPEIEKETVYVSLGENGALLLELNSNESLVFLSGDKEIDILKSGAVTARYGMYAMENTEFRLYMVLYNKGNALEMEKMEISDVCTAEAGETVFAEVSLDVKNAENHIIKAFISEDVLHPASYIYELAG